MSEMRTGLYIMCVSVAAAGIMVPGCAEMDDEALAPGYAGVTVRVAGPDGAVGKSEDPEESLISDVNLFIFNSQGVLDERRYFSGNELKGIRLIKGAEYTVYACVNLGFGIDDITDEEELKGRRYYMAYPDEYRMGMPMTGVVSGLRVEEDMDFTVPVTRMMARVSVSIDKSGLDEGVMFDVRSMRVGNCPNSACLYSYSKALGDRDVFANGFSKSDDIYGEVSLYLMENMQGDDLSGLCSYVELKVDYESDMYMCTRESYLLYRFYIRDADGSYNVRRNRHYHVTVRPVGDGLGTDDGWRVDTSHLMKRSGP
jgi:hypothetical protein